MSDESQRQRVSTRPRETTSLKLRSRCSSLFVPLVVWPPNKGSRFKHGKASTARADRAKIRDNNQTVIEHFLDVDSNVIQQRKPIQTGIHRDQKMLTVD